jgi:phosphopentomutase
MKGQSARPGPARRALLLVIDSLGIGSQPDAAEYGDAGADTLGHIAEACAAGRAEEGRRGPLAIPRLEALGLVRAAGAARGAPLPGFTGRVEPVAAWGFAAERSRGKDTISGHWEMAGQPVPWEWGYFTAAEDSMPAPLLAELARRAGLPGFLGNCQASGTEIIERLGLEHLRTGRPIVYTSADSVLQICAHEEAFGLERLYALCAIARELVDEYHVGRVIARPFIGTSAADFRRTAHRRDYAVPPPPGTLLDALCDAGGTVVGVGKVPDIFAGRGISRSVKASGLEALMEATTGALAGGPDRTLVFTNLVDFDQEYGHRRDVAGYARALEWLDGALAPLLAGLAGGDVVVITADHGNDPTWSGWNHTREYVPVLAHGPALAAGAIGRRDSFADIGQSLAGWFGLAPLAHGRSFIPAAAQARRQGNAA